MHCDIIFMTVQVQAYFHPNFNYGKNKKIKSIQYLQTILVFNYFMLSLFMQKIKNK